ncbi:dna-binding wrky domain-containing protein [Rutstroemia sp. NJR-2017a WRK4]|nr:dna-binding wrky domain-containing protein [Rutstroemia sp. NJR-2017a WRK4]PQE27398.1 dna-binding wrky domain-containing protein [Rutstroemia sp. NJR-2017a WRK4]
MGVSFVTTPLLILLGLVGSRVDILISSTFYLIRNRSDCADFLFKHVSSSTITTLSGCGSLLFILAQTIRYVRGLRAKDTHTKDIFLKPMFFPSMTSHMRLYPTKNAFSYSYLLTGVPIGWTGSSGGLIAADDAADASPFYWKLLCLQPMRAWFSVNGDAYLDRGHVLGGLEGKLKKFLHHQGLNHEDYPYAYLLTSSEFLGYQNNPVSIWNLYSREKELKAVILEVNNTFDERHIYFVTPEDMQALAPTSHAGKAHRFAKSWSKEFYVSPFNSRNGFYSISACDPFYPALTGCNPLDLTLTLSSTDRPFLVARLFSTGEALDPSTMSIPEKTRFLLSWWWVGFATFPRTLVQAWILFFRRNLPWVSRPEPLKVTISKNADRTEKYFEKLFRRYLRHLVETTNEGIILKYNPAGLLNNEEEVMYSSSAQISSPTAYTLELTILTPAFYTQLIKYTDIFNGFVMEAKDQTVSYSDVNLLASLLSQKDLSSKSTPPKSQQLLLFRVIRTWRHNFTTPSKTSPAPPINDSSALPLTPFDGFNLAQESTSASTMSFYIKTVLKLALSDYIALGWVDLLDFEWLVVRCAVLWWVIGKL